MEKDSYHHGTLREELIKKGMELIKEEGVKKFSLRRVAILCNVSHTAPYKHFKNKEELMDAITAYVLEDFTKEIEKIAEENPGEMCLLEVGKRYVTYMIEHKDYFYFMFQGTAKAKVEVRNHTFICDQRHPFKVFSEVAQQKLSSHISDKDLLNSLILRLWCEVHGIAHLFISGILETGGDYSSLTEKMLKNSYCL